MPYGLPDIPVDEFTSWAAEKVDEFGSSLKDTFDFNRRAEELRQSIPFDWGRPGGGTAEEDINSLLDNEQRMQDEERQRQQAEQQRQAAAQQAMLDEQQTQAAQSAVENRVAAAGAMPSTGPATSGSAQDILNYGNSLVDQFAAPAKPQQDSASQGVLSYGDTLVNQFAQSDMGMPGVSNAPGRLAFPSPSSPPSDPVTAALGSMGLSESAPPGPGGAIPWAASAEPDMGVSGSSNAPADSSGNAPPETAADVSAPPPSPPEPDDPWSRVGHALRDALTGANSAAVGALNQGADAIGGAYQGQLSRTAEEDARATEARGGRTAEQELARMAEERQANREPGALQPVGEAVGRTLAPVGEAIGAGAQRVGEAASALADPVDKAIEMLNPLQRVPVHGAQAVAGIAAGEAERMAPALRGVQKFGADITQGAIPEPTPAEVGQATEGSIYAGQYLTPQSALPEARNLDPSIKQGSERMQALNRQLQRAVNAGDTATQDLINSEMTRVAEAIGTGEPLPRPGGSVRAASALLLGGDQGPAAGIVSAEDAGRAADQNAPTFYSQLERTLEEKMPNRAGPEQIYGILRGSPVKVDEIKWSGLDDFLRERGGPVTKQEVLDHVRANNVQVEEVVKEAPKDNSWYREAEARYNELERRNNQAPGWQDAGGWLSDAEHAEMERLQVTLDNADTRGSGPAGTTKYGTYQLPGGENYRELLLTLPNKPRSTYEDVIARLDKKYGEGFDTEAIAPAERAELSAAWERLHSGPGAARELEYQSSHFSEPNILAHVRFNERTDAQGKRVLFVEEVQSDWHQAGRKQGYQGNATGWSVENTGPGDRWVIKDATGQKHWTGYATEEDARADLQQYVKSGSTGGVPDAPFQKTWPELAMKRVVRWAAENDFDKVAWTTGAQQAERYDLSKQVDRLVYFSNNDLQAFKDGKEILFQKDVAPEKLGDYVGREAAEKLLHSPTESSPGANGVNRVLSGVDLKMGGEGMQGFYDRMLPEVMNKLGKKFGARVGETDVITNPAYTAADFTNGVDDLTRQTLREKGEAMPVHALDITPEMKQSVLTQGQPLFLLPGQSKMGRAVARGATQGGVAGGYEASQQEGATPGSVLMGAGAGVAEGAALSGARQRFGPRVAGTIARAVRDEWKPSQSSDPNVKAVGEIFEKDIKAPESQLPMATRIAQALTDDRAPFAQLEKAVQHYGHALNPEDKVSLITRVNPDSVASQRLRDAVQPAIRQARQEGVSPAALSQYLAHMHNVDIAKEVGDRAYDAAIAQGQSVAAAQQAAFGAANNRQFTGGLTLSDTMQALATMRQDMGPQRATALDNAAQTIWDFNRETLDRKFAAGLLPQDLYTELQQRYPHYVTTHIVDHLSADTPSHVGGGGASVSMRSSPVKSITMKGTSADRLDPIASVALNTIESERMIARNEAYQAFRDLAAIDPSISQLVLPRAGARKGLGERSITGYINGERETVTLAKPLADVVEMATGGPSGPAALQMFMSVYKAALTSRNPGFALAVNPIRDFADFVPKQAGYEGGAHMLPAVFAEYVQSIPKAFSGLLTGEYKGDAARYLASGGGMGRVNTTPQAMKQFAEGMAQQHAFEIRGADDVKRLAADLLKFEWSQAIGDRVELIPRIAAMRRAEKSGAGGLESMIAGRDATIDFQRGGWLTRTLNTFIPFLNPTAQAGAQFGRALKDHPVAYVASGAAAIGTTTILSELWNNADAKRKQAYADVPQYQKDGGIVFMLPWAGTDQRGSRPNYAWIPLGISAPFATIARSSLNSVTNKKLEVPDAMAMLTQFSPVKGDTLTGAIAGLTPPVISTAAELRVNKDLYRNTPIATETRDETASAFSKWAAPILSRLGDSGLPLIKEFSGARPSQVEYALSADTGIYGQAVRGASDIAAGRQRQEDRPIQNAPLLGNVAGRLIRDTTGAEMDTARKQMITPSVKRALDEAGMRSDQLAGVQSEIQDMQLTRAEQVQYQKSFNEYLTDFVELAQDLPKWEIHPESREEMIRDAATKARARARKEVLADIDPSDKLDRRLSAVP